MNGQRNYVLDSWCRRGPSSCEVPIDACQLATSTSHARTPYRGIGTTLARLTKFLRGDHDETVPSAIPATGGGRRSFASRLAERVGADLSVTANQSRGTICGRRPDGYARTNFGGTAEGIARPSRDYRECNGSRGQPRG